MVKLFCAIVGVTGSAFSVDVGEGQTVDDLKNAIKNARRNTLNHVGAGDLQLFLAKKKKGKGAWLTEAEVVKGVTDTTDFDPLKFARSILDQVGLSEKDVRSKPTLEDAKVGNASVHVLVEISEVLPRKKQRVVGWKTQQILLDMMKLGQELNRATDLAEGTLLETPSTFHGVELERGLYVRQEYWDVYSILNKKLANKAVKRVLVIGSPGIGKSVFGVFLLLLFMSERKDVAYRPLRGVNELYFFTWGTENNCYEVSLEPVSERYYEGIFDGNDEGSAWFDDHFVHSYLFASTGTNNYHEFAKERCITISMNPWTTEECKKYVDKVKTPWAGIQSGPDTQNEWFMRYNIIGGKPRWLFSETLELKDLVGMVENAIPETFEDLKTEFRSIWTDRGYDGVKHVLFALFRDENKPVATLSTLHLESSTVRMFVSARFEGFPSIDGVLVVPREKFVIYLQTTVSLRHSIHHKALKDVIEILVKRQGYADYTHIFLFLTVEADTYDQFKKQRFKNVNNEDRQKVDNFEVVVKQYVGKIDNDETDSAASSPSSHNRRKRTSSEISGEECDDSSSKADTKQCGCFKKAKAPAKGTHSRASASGGDTKQRGGTKNPMTPVKRRSSTRTSSRSKKGTTSN